MIKSYKNYLLTGTSALMIGATLTIFQRLITRQIDGFLPRIHTIGYFNRPQTLVILSADDEVLQKIGPVINSKLEPSQVPSLLAKAFIAAEDRRFYQHIGVDFRGMGRAFTTNLFSNLTQEGASTITQQLARMVFLEQENGISRKIKEIIFAFIIEHELTKEQILTHYLNTIYLGSGAYGVTDASWTYFSKTPNQLNLAEIATIAGLPPAPSKYSPIINKKLCKERQAIVLKKMRQLGFITLSEESQAQSMTLHLKLAQPKFFPSKTPHFTSWLIEELSGTYNLSKYRSRGLTIWSSINLGWQKDAEKIIAHSTQDKIEGALVSIEPGTGLVRTMVGGRNFDQSQFNRTSQALRSPGSTFKIFTYITALIEGIQPGDFLLDTKRCFADYCPKNFTDHYQGYISLTTALKNSLNTIAISLFHQIGFEKIAATAKKFGFKTPLPNVYPVALGACEQTILGMTSAYTAIASRGIYIKPVPFEEIHDMQGKILWDCHTSNIKKNRAIRNSVAEDMLIMLQSAVKDGTGKLANLPNRPVAGKTGTSEGARDLWFIGSIPQLTTGVWFGYDNNAETDRNSSIATLAWNSYMEKVIEGLPIEYFPLKVKDANKSDGSSIAKMFLDKLKKLTLRMSILKKANSDFELEFIEFPDQIIPQDSKIAAKKPFP
uniref:peptidoglycan glycosyltransferase n=1 Tax=Paulinella longichromatophora TaxID=1708747 RepID=A0A2H4ZNX7_9EUKA|nr:putative penicillin binding protein [Paulinella longichromatophora]